MVGDKFVALAERVAIQWIRSQEIVFVIHRQRPETLHRRELSFVKAKYIFVFSAVVVIAVRVFLRKGIDRVRRKIPPRPKPGCGGAQQIIGAPVADVGAEDRAIH